jgi:hypothetical protein
MRNTGPEGIPSGFALVFIDDGVGWVLFVFHYVPSLQLACSSQSHAALSVV